MTEAPVFPSGRYGRRREPRRARRWVPAIVLVLVILVTFWLAERAFSRYGDPYQPHVTGLEQVTDTSATVVFTVRQPDRRPVACRLQARDGNGVEVGYVEVTLHAGGTVRETVGTTGRAQVVDVLGCRAG